MRAALAATSCAYSRASVWSTSSTSTGSAGAITAGGCGSDAGDDGVDGDHNADRICALPIMRVDGEWRVAKHRRRGGTAHGQGTAHDLHRGHREAAMTTLDGVSAGR